MPRFTSFALIVPFLLSACVTAPTLPDPHIAALSEAFQAQAASFFTDLTPKTSPECDYEHNKNIYEQLSGRSEELRIYLATAHASSALIRAAQALARTIVDAGRSHQLASATTGDANGSCMAPGAIAINADAIARASAALANTQQREGAAQ